MMLASVNKYNATLGKEGVTSWASRFHALGEFVFCSMIYLTMVLSFVAARHELWGPPVFPVFDSPSVPCRTYT